MRVGAQLLCSGLSDKLDAVQSFCDFCSRWLSVGAPVEGFDKLVDESRGRFDRGISSMSGDGLELQESQQWQKELKALTLPCELSRQR